MYLICYFTCVCSFTYCKILILICTGFCWWNVAPLCAGQERDVGISVLRKDSIHLLFPIELKLEVGV